MVSDSIYRRFESTMTDLVNNIVALQISSKDRINIEDSTTDFTIALKKSLRNIAAINVAVVVIPRTDMLIGSNNDTLRGAIIVDDIINSFEVSITRTDYTVMSLVTELQSQFDSNTDFQSFSMVVNVSYSSTTKRINIQVTYPLGSTHVWGIQIDFTGLRDIIGIGIAGTTSQTFMAASEDTVVNITCSRMPLLVRALSYNITSAALTNSVNTSYISSLGKLFNVNSANNRLTIESLITASATHALILPPTVPGEPNLRRFGQSVSLSATGLVMVVGSFETGVCVFTRSTLTSAWIQTGDPLLDYTRLYSYQGWGVAISGDASTLAFTAVSYSEGAKVYVYIKSGSSWIFQQKMHVADFLVSGRGCVALSIDGTTMVVGKDGGNSPGYVSVFVRLNGLWSLQQSLTVPSGDSVEFGNSVSISNDGNVLTASDSYLEEIYVYRRTNTTWALEQTIIPNDKIGTINIEHANISGDGLYVAFSASNDDGGIGAVWIYFYNGSAWINQRKIVIGSKGNFLNKNGERLVICSNDGNKLSIYKRSGSTWTVELNDYTLLNTSGNVSPFEASINAEGSSFVVGGYTDNSNVGAVWTLSRSGTTWTQIGTKTTAGDGKLLINFGKVIAMSEDGKIVAVGHPSHADGVGIVYVYSNNGFTWSIQATISPSNIVNYAHFGTSLALSSDGSTLAIGAPNDTANTGAIWIFKRIGVTWTQSVKIAGNGAPSSQQGNTLTLSSAGDMIVIGDLYDTIRIMKLENSVWVNKVTNLGAGIFSNHTISKISMNSDMDVILVSSESYGAVVFTSNSNGSWEPSPNFLTIHTPISANGSFGISSDISPNGKTVVICDDLDNGKGAGFVFTTPAKGGVWAEITSLVGSGTTNNRHSSVSIANNGSTIILGGGDAVSNGFIMGGVWLFDYNGASWSQRGSPVLSIGPKYFGSRVYSQKFGEHYIASDGGRSDDPLSLIVSYTPSGYKTESLLSFTIPQRSYSVFDLVNVLNKLMENAIALGNGYQISFDGENGLTISSTIEAPITSNTLRVSRLSTFNIAYWFDQEYKLSRISNPVNFSINNDVLKSIINHSDNSDNVIVDNSFDTIYRKYPAGYTVESGMPIDIQLRNNRDQIIDLNGADWIMTIYATIRA